MFSYCWFMFNARDRCSKCMKNGRWLSASHVLKRNWWEENRKEKFREYLASVYLNFNTNRSSFEEVASKTKTQADTSHQFFHKNAQSIKNVPGPYYDRLTQMVFGTGVKRPLFSERPKLIISGREWRVARPVTKNPDAKHLAKTKDVKCGSYKCD